MATSDALRFFVLAARIPATISPPSFVADWHQIVSSSVKRLLIRLLSRTKSRLKSLDYNTLEMRIAEIARWRGKCKLLNDIERNIKMQKQKGFSLIELLIVVAIILIIAAIAIPNLLRARIAANESSAVSGIRTINTAEVSYSMAFPTVGYSLNLGQLGPGAVGTTCPATGPTSTNACLIDSVVSNAITAGTAKSGFYYGLVGVVGAGGTLRLTYGVGAAPSAFNQTGVRNFCSAEDGVIHFNAGASGAAPVTGGAGTCTGNSYPVLQ